MIPLNNLISMGGIGKKDISQYCELSNQLLNDTLAFGRRKQRLFFVFGGNRCPFCRKAVALLKLKREKFRYINARYAPRPPIPYNTIPQIWFMIRAPNGVTWVGGFTELMQLLRPTKAQLKKISQL